MAVVFYPDLCLCRKEDADHMDTFHMGVYQSMYQSIYHFEDDLAGYIEAHPRDIVKVLVYHRDTAARARTRKRIEGLGLCLADAETTSLECSPEGISKAGLEGALARAWHPAFGDGSCRGWSKRPGSAPRGRMRYRDGQCHS